MKAASSVQIELALKVDVEGVKIDVRGKEKLVGW